MRHQATLLSLTSFFIIGIGILLTTNVRQAITDAGNEMLKLVQLWYSYTQG